MKRYGHTLHSRYAEATASWPFQLAFALLVVLAWAYCY